jgi:1,2-diacylglycerol 3-alpha-glucosyltransferase
VRIAFFADSYKPYLSGVTNSAEILVNELRRLGHRVYIFAPHYPGYKDTDPDIYRFPSIAGGYPKFRLALPFVKRVPEVDLIHSHSPFQAGLLAQLVARRRKIPFVYSFHTLFTRYVHFAKFIPPALAKAGIVAYLKAFCRGADTIITPSTLAKRVLRAWGIKQPVEIVPSGVELQKYSAEPAKTRNELRQKYGLKPDDKVLLYAGRLSKEKNLPFLLEAYKSLQDLKLTTYNLQLVLVGGGPLEEKVKNQKSKIKNIVLTGEIPYPEVLNYYLMGDVFIFASLTETQGMVLAEAKAAGLPVVALFAGGLTGTVRSGIDGYLVRRDLSSFVEHVERLLSDDELRAKMSLAARADAHTRFSSDVVAKQVETVYNSLIRKGGNSNV